MPAAWVAIAGAVAGLGSAYMSSNAAKSAADTQSQGANAAAQVARDQFNTITKQQQPFVQSGYGALNQLNYLMGIGLNPNAAPAPNQGVDPRTGYAINPNGSIGQRMMPGPASPVMGGNPSQGAGNEALTPGMANFSFGSLSDWLNPISTQNPIANPGGAIIGNAINGNAQGVLTGGLMPSAQGQNTPMPTPQEPLPTAPISGNVINSGSSPAGGYGSLLTPFTAENFKQLSPAYQFQLQQGQQGVLNSAAPNQGALSGAALKDLMSYNQNLANTSFNTAFNQYQTQQGNVFNRLSGLAQLGQAAAANTGQQGTALAGQIGQSISNAASAQAAGQIGSANAYSSGVNNALPWLMSGNYGGSTPPASEQMWV